MTLRGRPPSGPIPREARSLTHEHLLAALATELPDPAAGTVRVLDVGCGNGELIGYLHEALGSLFPEYPFEIHGFDLVDHGIQRGGVLEEGLAGLRERHPDVDWSRRVRFVTEASPWPWEDEAFDVVISNQVVEHVADVRAFFADHHRVLKPYGIGIHLFPVRECVFDDHLDLPFVHRMSNHDLLRNVLGFLSRIGMGKFRVHHRDTGVALERFVDRHSDYLYFKTSYRSAREILGQARASGLRASFRYTHEFYRRKVRQVTGRPPVFLYDRERAITWDPWMSPILKRISSVTLFLEKKQVYVK